MIDLLCRGASLAALAWAVFSMGFSSAERKSAEVRIEQPDHQHQPGDHTR